MSASERRAVATLASVSGLRMTGLFMVLPLLAVYAADLPGATPYWLGVAVGIHGLTQAALQIPLGWLSDKVGRRPVLIGALLVFTFGSVWAALADTLMDIVIGRCLQGGGAIAAALMAFVADYTRLEQRTKAMASVGISIAGAFVIALILGPVVAAWSGLSGVFWLSVMFGALAIALVLFALPPTPTVAVPQGTAVENRWASAFQRGLLSLYGSIFLLHMVLMAAFVVLPSRLSGTLMVPAAEHWWIYLISVLLSIPGVVLLLRGRSGRNDLRPVMVTAVLIFVVGLYLAVHVAQWTTMVAMMVVFFTGFNTLEALLPSLVSERAPGARRGTAMGVFSTAQFLGTFLGGWLGGHWLAGDFQISIAVPLVLLLGWGLLVAVFPPRSHPPHHSE